GGNKSSGLAKPRPDLHKLASRAVFGLLWKAANVRLPPAAWGRCRDDRECRPGPSVPVRPPAAGGPPAVVGGVAAGVGVGRVARPAGGRPTRRPVRRRPAAAGGGIGAGVVVDARLDAGGADRDARRPGVGRRAGPALPDAVAAAVRPRPLPRLVMTE